MSGPGDPQDVLAQLSNTLGGLPGMNPDVTLGGGPTATPTMAPAHISMLQKMAAMMGVGGKAMGAAGVSPGAPSGGGGGGGTAARVGGAPTQVIPGLGPGMGSASGGPAAMMSPAQAGGPAARLQVGDSGMPTSFPNSQARTASIVENMGKGVIGLVQGFKQQRFESEAAESNMLALGKFAKDKVESGTPVTELSPQEKQAYQAYSDPKNQKKAPKIMEKAMTDPMSGAYVGYQRAIQSAQQSEMQKAALQEQYAKAKYQEAEAYRAKSEGDYYKDFKGQNEATRASAASERNAIEKSKIIAKAMQANAAKNGMMIDLDSDGAPKMKDGQIEYRPMTKDDVKNNPELSAKFDLETARANELYKRGEAEVLRAHVAQWEHQRKAANDAAASQPGAVDQVKKMLLDPNVDNGRLAHVPPKVYTAALSALQKEGKEPVRAFSTNEMRTIQLAGNADDNLTKIRELVSQHPEMFGNGSYGIRLWKKAIGDRNDTAQKIMVLAKTAALPTIGIHGSRSQKLAQDITDSNSDLYQSQESFLGGLDELIGSVKELETNAGRRPQPSGGAAPAAPAGDKKDAPTGGKGKDPLGLFN